MAAQHSSLHRGQTAAAENPNLQGARFGRLFPDLKTASYGATPQEEAANLERLADAMVSSVDFPKDAPDDEESAIPALYTYFGQFIDHDLTFDPDGSFQKLKDPAAVVDFRTPAFDLDNLYGRGPGDQPYMYDAAGRSLLLGDPLTGGAPHARDLQRNGAGRALIGDPRNDENTIVSQLQGLFLRFHNRLAATTSLTFAELQAEVRHHYQYIVINDFLPRIVQKTVLDEYRPNGVFDRSKLKFFTNFGPPLHTPYMPMEFSVGAYRFGHSMVRPGYRLNDATLMPIFPLKSEVKPGFPEGLTGFRRMISDWGIDWGRFIDIDERAYGAPIPDPPAQLDKAQILPNFKRLQLAYRIDTAIVDPLKHLPLPVAGNRPSSLALRNLERGTQFKLPNGQDVARAMGVEPLEDTEILIGQGVDGAKNRNILEKGGSIFAGNCPLWTYILAEAMNTQALVATPTVGGRVITTPQLGPVGGGIVAEVFLGLLFNDPSSFLSTDPTWTPSQGPNFKLKDLVMVALQG